MNMDSVIALLTLTSLEIVLGIDNIIFLAILANKLPEHERNKARVFGLAAAVISRLMLLGCITFVMQATKPFLHLGQFHLSVKDLILIVGGVFLIYKSGKEIHEKIEHTEHADRKTKAESLRAVILQVMIIDVIFSLDSVITAVGMAKDIWVMVAAVIISAIIMIVFSQYIINFVDKHPAIKILALSFLILIGTLLIAEGVHQKDMLPKGYVYFAMAFSVVVETLRMLSERKHKRFRMTQQFQLRLVVSAVCNALGQPEE